MGDVATTTIVHDGKVIEAGEAVDKKSMTDTQYKQLVDSGAIGDVVLSRVAARSTAAQLQAEDVSLAEYTSPIIPVNAPTEEEEARALALRTDQVSRAAGKDAGDVAVKAATDSAKAEKDANEKSAKEAAKRPSVAAHQPSIPGTFDPEHTTEIVTKQVKRP